MIKENKDKACSVSGVTQQRTTKKMEQENAQGDAQKKPPSIQTQHEKDRKSFNMSGNAAIILGSIFLCKNLSSGFFFIL